MNIFNGEKNKIQNKNNDLFRPLMDKGKSLILCILLISIIFSQFSTVRNNENNKQNIEKQRRLESCNKLINVRLTHDITNSRDLILSIMDSYKVAKEEALKKVNSFLSVSCLYNILPQDIEEILSFKNVTEINTMKNEFVKILELEEWYDLHLKGDVKRIKEKLNFLNEHYSKFKEENYNKNKSPKSKLLFLGIDLLNMGGYVKYLIFIFLIAIFLVIFVYLLSKIKTDRSGTKKRN